MIYKVQINTYTAGDPISIATAYLYIGLSSDEKPAYPSVGSWFIEEDTGKVFGLEAGVWTERALTVTPADHNHTAPGDGGILTNDEHDGYIEMSEIDTPPAPVAGKVRTNPVNQNGYTVLERTDSTGNVGRLLRDNFFIAKIDEAGGIAKGDAVYLSGASGANEHVSLAKADDISTMPCAGIALDSGADNDFIRVLFSGKILGVTFGEGIGIGDRLYVSDSVAGELINTPPAVLITQRVGIVTRVAGQGEMLVVLGQVSQAWGEIRGTLSDQTDLQAELDALQETLVSGTNIKTVNGSTLLGSGDLTISAGDPSYSPGSFTVATETAKILCNHLILTGSERVTLEGTARLQII